MANKEGKAQKKFFLNELAKKSIRNFVRSCILSELEMKCAHSLTQLA
jgi:hypothetical protein